MNVVDLMTHPRLLGRTFVGESWAAWRVLLAVIFGLPLAGRELVLFRMFTGRNAPRNAGYREAWLICGRRAGKSQIVALIAIFLALQNYAEHLSPGEVPIVAVLGADRPQALVVFKYTRGLLHSCPALKKLIVRETAQSIELTTGVTIEVATSSFRSIRGRTIVAAICDEIGFWMDDTTANPDTEIVGAVRPTLITTRGRLIGFSSPYGKSGVLYDAHATHYGVDDSEVLVWQASSVSMNPTLDQAWIAKEIKTDPERNTSEYLATFRDGIAAFVSRESAESCVVEARHSLPPLEEFSYCAFADPSGGRGDSFTLAIAHRESEEHPVVIDVVREVRPPFSPETVVAELVPLLRMYDCREVSGDRYAAGFVVDAFAKHDVVYVASELTKSALYIELLALINSGGVELPDHPKLLTQLCSLERRTARSGRDSIDHPRKAHDDLANCVAGAAWLASQGRASGDLGITLANGTWDFSRDAERVHVTPPIEDPPPRHVAEWNTSRSKHECTS